jgi:hypothetical protein
MIKNNELIHPFDVTSNESGKTYQLTPNSSKSVQPVALLRLSVFTLSAQKKTATETLKLMPLMSFRVWKLQDRRVMTTSR